MDKKQILIIDDNMDLRLMLEKRFTGEGYSAITAYNGNNALPLAKSEQPDVIILDRVLGDMLGEEVAAKLRDDPETKDIPIIFLSALFSKEDEIKNCHIFNGSYMFAKPYDVEELLAVIEKLVGRRRKLSLNKKVIKMDKKKILIVDDEKDVLVVLERRLIAEGYSVITTDNGNDAIMLAKSEFPDLVILDIWMPNMEGTEVAAILKGDIKTKDIPVIFLTCLLEKEEEEKQGHVIGSNIFFAKPYDIEKLLTAIEELLSGCTSISHKR